MIIGEKDHYCNGSFGAWTKLAIYGGSFSPLHDAHKQVKEISEKILGIPVWFELSIKNADKGMIDYVDINDRLKRLYDTYLVTKHSTIKDKVDLIKKYNPNCEITFVLGVDTYNRIWDKKYLPDMSLNDLHDFFYNSNVKFLVFGRNGIKINDNYDDLRIMSDEAANFNMNISSTELRNKLV
jgi:nicotinic acid mononucleotide adenylyltransferase